MVNENTVTVNITELKAGLFDKFVKDIMKDTNDENCCIVATNMIVASEIVNAIERLGKGC